jgi:hypothetical protein
MGFTPVYTFYASGSLFGGSIVYFISTSAGLCPGISKSAWRKGIEND